jgi:hypothetical protein
LLDDCAVFKVRREGTGRDSADGLSKLNSMRALRTFGHDSPWPAPRASPDPVDVRNPIEGEMRAA